MGIPFQCLEACGSILVAARGGSIYTFSSDDGHHISAWSHPSSKSQAAASENEIKPDLETTASTIQDDPDQASEPASKRRKFDSGAEAKGDDGSTETAEAGGSQKGKNNKNKGGTGSNHAVSNMPMIICMKTTPDGQYIVAVTGQDKTVWVLEHDGAGNLKQLSERSVY